MLITNNVDSAIKILTDTKKPFSLQFEISSFFTEESRYNFFHAVSKNQFINLLTLQVGTLDEEDIDELGKALEQHSSLNFLCFDMPQINKVVIQALSNVIPKTNIKKLFMFVNNCTIEIMQELAKLLENTKQLETFAMNFGSLSDGISFFIKASWNHPNIRYLQLQGFQINKDNMESCKELLSLNPFLTVNLQFNKFEGNLEEKKTQEYWINHLNQENVKLNSLREHNDGEYLVKIRERYNGLFSIYKTDTEKLQALEGSRLAKEAKEVPTLLSIVENKFKVWIKSENPPRLKHGQNKIMEPIQWLFNNYCNGERGNLRFENFISILHKKEKYKEVHKELILKGKRAFK